MSYNKIGFIGLGLIGGSIAKTIHARYPSIQLKALTSHQSTIDEAYQDGVITNSTEPALQEMTDCDVIFLCSPVGVNISYLKELKPILKPDCLLTDVGSVKGDIQKAVVELGLDGQFIGGHPMCGSEATGYSHATDHMLENAYYLLTHTDAITRSKADEFSAFIKSLGALVKTMTPAEHDFDTAAISHLPHIISASLVNVVRENDDDQDTLKQIAAGGFRDITRISSSSPVMWRHICLSNRDEILKLIGIYEKKLSSFKDLIAAGDGDRIQATFQEAKDYRDSLAVRGKGSIPEVYEFYCDLLDQVGGIATIATILSVNQLSIKNIGIVHNREFEDGVLHIEMYDEASLEEAIALLEHHHYTIHRR